MLVVHSLLYREEVSAQRGTSGAVNGGGGRSAPDPRAHLTTNELNHFIKSRAALIGTTSHGWRPVSIHVASKEPLMGAIRMPVL